MMTPAERLRDIPAAEKQRALDEPVSVSEYTEDQDFPSPVKSFMRGVFLGAIALLSIAACHAAVLGSQ